MDGLLNDCSLHFEIGLMFAIALCFQSRCDKLRRFLVETNGGLPHTQERCKSLKEKQDKEKQTKREITLEMGQRKLESIGIIINVERLMKEKRPNGNVMCGQIIPKYSLVSDHVLKHVKESEREK
ncbi:MAG: hypothetical protein QOK54_11180 [Nitrososphaeraceae archaeon]|nr:hypothetical protein [Nitrososphaeraceae archaeon]